MSDEGVPAKVGWWGRHSGRLVLLGLLVFALVLWPFSDWNIWAWAFGLGATILVGVTLGAIGARERLGPTWILSAGLVVVVVFLIQDTTVAVWGLGAGVVLTLLGIVAVTGKVGLSRKVWLTSLIAGPLLLVTCTVFVVIGAIQLHQQQERAAQEAHEFYVARILPDPRGGTLALVEAVGFNKPDTVNRVCMVFTERARAQFAAAHGARDCAGAIANLHRQVDNRAVYVNDVWIPNEATRLLPDGKTTVLDACHLEFGNFIKGEFPNAGPQLGTLRWEQQQGQGSYLIGYQPCSVA